MSVIVFIVIVLFVALLAYVIRFVVIPKRDLRILHKRFNELELNSSWVLKSESTNPFTANKVRVVSTQMGTDGKTPWVIIERKSGFKDYMKFEDFISIYTQI